MIPDCLDPRRRAPPFACFATTGTLRDFRLVNLAANLIWSPVRDLDIGVEVAYDRINVSGRVVDLNKCGGLAVIPAGLGHLSFGILTGRGFVSDFSGLVHW